MRTCIIVALAFCLCLCAFGQTSNATVATPAPLTQNVYGAGVSYNQAGTPGIAGTALYAHAVASTGTYAFTVADFAPNNSKPFTVSANIGAGIAQKVATIAGVDIFVPTAAGISFSGSNTGWAWSTGGMAIIKLKNNWLLMPNVRVLKSSVSGGTGYQPIIGMMVGWGK